MIEINKYELKNGLRLIHSCDPTIQMATVNTLYDVGAKKETPGKTGLAHLMEHLMFAGSRNVKNINEHIRRAGGSLNAFTDSDITNYYFTIPCQNIETALWIESDRMANLDVTKEKYNVQHKVVFEEYNQCYVNRPYGDLYSLMKKLHYGGTHYSWTAIGIDGNDIQNIKYEDVIDFYQKYYGPNNAIISICGNISFEESKRLVEKWFGDIPRIQVPPYKFYKKTISPEGNFMEVERDVPMNVLVKTYGMGRKNSDNARICDAISDLLSNGDSSVLYKNLVKERQIFSNISAGITPEMESGMFTIVVYFADDMSFEDAEKYLHEELEKFVSTEIDTYSLEKIKNKFEVTTMMNMMDGGLRAKEMAIYELCGDANDINTEVAKYRSVTQKDVMDAAKQLFLKSNTSTLYYKKKGE